MKINQICEKCSVYMIYYDNNMKLKCPICGFTKIIVKKIIVPTKGT